MAQARAVLRVRALLCEPLPVALRQGLLGIEPEIRGSGQRLVARGPQRSVLTLADRVNHVAHVRHDVIAIEPDLGLGLRHVGPDRLEVGLPQVQGDGLDARPLLVGQAREVLGQARLLALLPDELDGGAIQVADQGEVVMRLGDRLLADAQVGGDAGPLGALPSLDRALENVPGLVPTDAQDPAGAPMSASWRTSMASRSKRVVNRARAFAHGSRTCRTPWVGHSTRAGLGVQVGQELAAVQMPPHAFLGVVIEHPGRRRTRDTASGPPRRARPTRQLVAPGRSTQPTEWSTATPDPTGSGTNHPPQPTGS